MNGTNEISSKSALLLSRVTQPLHKQVAERNVTAVYDLIAGGIAGSAGIVVGHPFDTLKVRAQTGGNAMAQFGGIGTLFRGIGAPFATAALVNASIFCTYGESSRFWDRYLAGSNKHKDLVVQKPLVCGTFVGVSTSLIICPAEHVKIRLQTQRCGEITYRNSLDAARKILGSHGVRGMYRGLYATCWRQGPSFGLYFATYDRVKEWGQRNFKKGYSHNFKGTKHHHLTGSTTWLASIMAGGVAGTFAWAVVYPVDLIKK
jgi:solute carrier family 25 carnitine/acylcarnitine transporter 20/29